MRTLSYLLLLVALCDGIFAKAQSTQFNFVGTNQVWRLSSGLTNRMRELDAFNFLETKGLKCGHISSDPDSRYYHYVLTNGYLRFFVHPNHPLSKEQWYSNPMTNGSLCGAQINGVSVLSTNAPWRAP